MANKYDLRIVHVQSTSATDEIIADAVPAGKTRFVCMVKYGMTAGGAGITIGESVADPWTTMETVKDIQIDLGAKGTIIFPDKVDVDNPLFSIAAGRKLLYTGTNTDVEIGIVYFDE